MNRAQKLADRLNKTYGDDSAGTGNKIYKLNVIPTGILSLDYALGTGGWPRGQITEVYGAPDVGKTSILGLGAIRNAQAQGLICGIIALEPSFDPEWAIKNGVDPDQVVIARPNTGEQAFQILHSLIADDNHVDFVIFDSIGAVLRGTEQELDGKMAMGGQSGLITWGIKRIVMPAFKNNVGVMLLNQVRDNMTSHIAGLVESPGGHALKHSAAIRVHLKNLGSPIKAKHAGEDVIVGREVVADIKRNKLHEGSNHRAAFTFYQMDTADHPVGIDQTSDILATAIRTGVITKEGSWYKHPSFPGDKGIFGKPAVNKFFSENTSLIDEIRARVLEKVVTS